MADLLASLSSLDDDARLVALDILVRSAWPLRDGETEARGLGKLFAGHHASPKDASWADGVRTSWARFATPPIEDGDVTSIARASLAQLSDSGGRRLTPQHGDEYLSTLVLQEAARHVGVDPSLSPASLARAIVEFHSARVAKTEGSIVGRTASLLGREKKDQSALQREHAVFMKKSKRTTAEQLAFFVWVVSAHAPNAARDASLIQWPSSVLDDNALTVPTTPEIKRIVEEADHAAADVAASAREVATAASVLRDAERSLAHHEDVRANGPGRLRSLESDLAQAERALPEAEAQWGAARQRDLAAASAVKSAMAALQAFRDAFQPRFAAADSEDARRALEGDLDTQTTPYRRALEEAEREVASASQALAAATKVREAALKSVDDSRAKRDNLEEAIQNAPVLIEAARGRVNAATSHLAGARDRAESAPRIYGDWVERLRTARQAQLDEYGAGAHKFAEWWPAALSQALGTSVKIAPGQARRLSGLPAVSVHAIELAIWELVAAASPAALATLQLDGKRAVGVAVTQPIQTPDELLQSVTTASSPDLVLERGREIPTPQLGTTVFDIAYEDQLVNGVLQIVGIERRMRPQATAGKGVLGVKLPWSRRT